MKKNNKSKVAKIKKLKSINIIANKKTKKNLFGTPFTVINTPSQVLGPMIANQFDLQEKTFLMFGLNNKYTYSSNGINWIVDTYPLYDTPIFAQSFKGNIYVLGLLGNIATYVPSRGWIFRNITFPNNQRVKAKFLFFSNDGFLGLYADDNKIYWSAESSDLSQGNYHLYFNLRTTISKPFISSIITKENLHSEYVNNTAYGGPIYRIDNFFKPTNNPKVFTENGKLVPTFSPANNIYVTDQLYVNKLFMYLAYEPRTYKSYIFVYSNLTKNIFTKVKNLPLTYDNGFIRMAFTNSKVALLSSDYRWNNYCVVSKDNMKTWTKHALPEAKSNGFRTLISANNILIAKRNGNIAHLSLV